MSTAGSSARESLPLILVVAIAVPVLFGLHLAVQQNPGERGWEFFPDMVHSVAADSQAQWSTDALESGLVEQPLAEGVVLRDHATFAFGPGEEEAVRAGREVSCPLDPADEAVVARGADVYRIHCAVCHGGDGEGKGTAVMRGMLPPPSLGADRARSLPDGQLFHIVTYGQGNMSPLRARLEPRDRWAAVLHVRKLQGGGEK